MQGVSKKAPLFENGSSGDLYNAMYQWNGCTLVMSPEEFWRHRLTDREDKSLTQYYKTDQFYV